MNNLNEYLEAMKKLHSLQREITDLAPGWLISSHTTPHDDSYSFCIFKRVLDDSWQTNPKFKTKIEVENNKLKIISPEEEHRTEEMMEAINCLEEWLFQESIVDTEPSIKLATA